MGSQCYDPSWFLVNQKLIKVQPINLLLTKSQVGKGALWLGSVKFSYPRAFLEFRNFNMAMVSRETLESWNNNSRKIKHCFVNLNQHNSCKKV